MRGQSLKEKLWILFKRFFMKRVSTEKLSEKVQETARYVEITSQQELSAWLRNYKILTDELGEYEVLRDKLLVAQEDAADEVDEDNPLTLVKYRTLGAQIKIYDQEIDRLNDVLARMAAPDEMKAQFMLKVQLARLGEAESQGSARTLNRTGILNEIGQLQQSASNLDNSVIDESVAELRRRANQRYSEVTSGLSTSKERLRIQTDGTALDRHFGMMSVREVELLEKAKAKKSNKSQDRRNRLDQESDETQQSSYQ
jgi:hypothetical protein